MKKYEIMFWVSTGIIFLFESVMSADLLFPLVAFIVLAISYASYCKIASFAEATV